MFRLAFLGGADALHRENGILRAAVAFLANAHLFSPEIAVDGVTLRHFVVTETLGKAHACSVAEFAEEGEHLPLDVGGRALGRVVEKDLVLDLQPAQLLIEEIHFLFNGHRGPLATSVQAKVPRGEVPTGQAGNSTKVWAKDLRRKGYRCSGEWRGASSRQ